MSLILPSLPPTPAAGAADEAWKLYNAQLQRVLADRQQIIVEAQLAASAANTARTALRSQRCDA